MIFICRLRPDVKRGRQACNRSGLCAHAEDNVHTELFANYMFCLTQGYEDPHKTLPSVVVHVRGLVDGVTEADLVEALQEFGAIRSGKMAASLVC